MLQDKTMNIDFPYHFDGRGRTAATDDADHIRDMIEQLLFTSPSERVNRPDFGSGLLQMVFAPNSPELAAALQYTTQAALQRYLGDVIDLQSLEVTAQDSTLSVMVKYVVKTTGDPRTENFVRSAPSV
jgi:phage baseplate assembly protein W